jgi:hypothetical protein
MKSAMTALVALVLLGSACEEQKATGTPNDKQPADRDKPGTDKVIPGNVTAALTSIAAARCEREVRCNNIGADKKYASKEACVAKIKEDKIDGLNADDCKYGIDQKELGECMTEIRNEDCNNPLDAIGRLAACRTSDICKATATPGNK